MDLSENQFLEFVNVPPEVFEQFLIETDIPYERIDRVYATYVEWYMSHGHSSWITSESQFVADVIAKQPRVFQVGPFLVNLRLKANK
jgi:hypothetical protein